jgi:hypothetical protein
MVFIAHHKILAALVGVLVLLALCAGTAAAVTNAANRHNLAVQRAAATASHRQAVASARAQAKTNALNKAIAAANHKAEKAARAARQAKRAARRAANKPAPAPVVVPARQAAQPPAYDSPPQADLNVVEQYFYEISSGDYSDAWAMGGVNIAGTDYNTWVAGYATTTSVTLDSDTDLGNGAVQVSFTATQSDGGSTSYAGTYHVNGAGVITSASITQNG